MLYSGNTLKSILYSVLLHATAIGLLIVSIDNTPVTIPPPRKNVDIVKAVAVDNKQVEAELQRLKEIEDKKLKQQQELEKKLKNLQRKSAVAERKRKTEEKRLADLQKKKADEQKRRKQEQKKLAQLKKEKEELERKRKLEEEKARKAEEERKQQEQEQKRIAEEERKKREAEQALQQQLAEEQRLKEQAQKAQDQQLLRNIVSDIYRRIVNNFNKSGLPPGLECVLTVRLIPGGEIINVSISQTSGNDIFDRRALVAIQKASPLPVPDDIATFERLNLRQFAFRFRPQD